MNLKLPGLTPYYLARDKSTALYLEDIKRFVKHLLESDVLLYLLFVDPYFQNVRHYYLLSKLLPLPNILLCHGIRPDLRQGLELFEKILGPPDVTLLWDTIYSPPLNKPEYPGERRNPLQPFEYWGSDFTPGPEDYLEKGIYYREPSNKVRTLDGGRSANGILGGAKPVGFFDKFLARAVYTTGAVCDPLCGTAPLLRSSRLGFQIPVIGNDNDQERIDFAVDIFKTELGEMPHYSFAPISPTQKRRESALAILRKHYGEYASPKELSTLTGIAAQAFSNRRKDGYYKTKEGRTQHGKGSLCKYICIDDAVLKTVAVYRPRKHWPKPQDIKLSRPLIDDPPFPGAVHVAEFERRFGILKGTLERQIERTQTSSRTEHVVNAIRTDNNVWPVFDKDFVQWLKNHQPRRGTFDRKRALEYVENHLVFPEPVATAKEETQAITQSVLTKNTSCNELQDRLATAITLDLINMMKERWGSELAPLIGQKLAQQLAAQSV